MKEIKFRGRRIDNGELVYGFYIKYEHMGIIKHIIVTDWAQVYSNSYYVDPTTVGQFTGLPDKNKKEIYEGDIVYAQAGEECYGAREYTKTITINNLIGDAYDLGFYEDLLIIGNIYENNELVGLNEIHN
jgi:uncharacterized phage protein (TIGR01671 family)